jgi:hypothetical protein
MHSIERRIAKKLNQAFGLAALGDELMELLGGNDYDGFFPGLSNVLGSFGAGSPKDLTESRFGRL